MHPDRRGGEALRKVAAATSWFDEKLFPVEAPDRTGRIVKPIAPAFFDWFANYGINYQTPRRAFYIEARTTIFPEAVTTLPSATDLRPTYLARRQRWDMTVRYRYNQRYALELNVGNVLDVPSREILRGGRRRSSGRKSRLIRASAGRSSQR